MKNLSLYKQKSSEWFQNLQQNICAEFEKIEFEFQEKNNLQKKGFFNVKKWNRLGKRYDQRDEKNDGGGGQMMIMTDGLVFESVAVNFSEVYGEFNDILFNEIKKNQETFQAQKNANIEMNQSKNFYATGISLIAHMQNPHVPAVHFNTRFISSGSLELEKFWFAGGYDLTPLYVYDEDFDYFHNKTKSVCDKHNPEYYPKFKKQCDEYFYLPHRGEPRGIGGIFYDYLNNDNFENDFKFNCDVGLGFLEIYSKIVRSNMYKSFNDIDREKLYYKRGRYVEFNLLYDRGTRFGLLTGGNTDSILSSLPPMAKWKNEGLS